MTDLLYWALFVFKWSAAAVGIFGGLLWAHHRLYQDEINAKRKEQK